MIKPEILNLSLPQISAMSLIAFAITRSVRNMIISKQNGQCADCGIKADKQLEIHHKLPKFLGGSDHPDNLVGLCGQPLTIVMINGIKPRLIIINFLTARLWKSLKI